MKNVVKNVECLNYQNENITLHALMSKKNNKTTNVNDLKGINISSKLWKGLQQKMAASVAQMLSVLHENSTH